LIGLERGQRHLQRLQGNQINFSNYLDLYHTAPDSGER
jgi:hypothetical protein